VASDVATSTATTGGATMVEQALEALGLDVSVRPLSALPEESKELAPLQALLLDDPGGLVPEARGALHEWLERGGVALACLGPRAESVQLGTTLEPFVRGAVSWEATKATGVAEKSVAWLGAAGASLSALAPRGRARLDSALPPGARVTGRWSDEAPFGFEQDFGRGLAITLSLPTSPDESDFPLRPGFLALLEHVVESAERRAGPRRSVAGAAWTFPGATRVDVEGPKGRLVAEPSTETRTFVPTLAGRYRVDADGALESRIVGVEAPEIIAQPKEPDAGDAKVMTGGVDGQVDVSRELALLLLALFALELAARAAGRLRPRRRRRGGDAARPSGAPPAPTAS
jgi:hypothetical protein